MPMYVDNTQPDLARMIVCHMLSDGTDKLFVMADAIGLHRKWFADLKERQKTQNLPKFLN